MNQILVHLKFKLMPETLYLTVNLIDRFLEKKVVARQRLQLVGVTCMLLASKYEEIYFPEVRDFVYITDRAYTRQQILQMESLVLNALGFELTVPTAIVFTKRFLKAGSASRTTKQLALYFCERTLQEYAMLKYMPSTIAASTTCPSPERPRSANAHATPKASSIPPPPKSPTRLSGGTGFSPCRPIPSSAPARAM